MEGADEAKALLKGVEWFYHWEDERGERRRLEVWYRLRVGSQARRQVVVPWSDLEASVRRRLDALVAWVMPQLPKPASYEIMGRRHEPRLSFDYLFLHVHGETDHKDPLTVGSCVWTAPGKNDPQRDQYWRADQLAGEVEEIRRSLVPLAWRVVLADVAQTHEVPPKEARPYLPLLVYVAYRAPTGERLARSITDYLSARGLLPWFDQEVIGTGDSLTEAMRRGIMDSSAAVVIFTPDFKDGKNLRLEIEQINARLQRDSDFKLIPVRVGLNHDELPPLHGNPRSEYVHDADDPKLTDVLVNVHRGILGMARKEGEGGAEGSIDVAGAQR
ncbi:MAG: hypothetical protein QOE90_3522 [Thermoplasmata archaeon]|nr:hypothetical protein [Thermoplasmata archaeon]